MNVSEIRNVSSLISVLDEKNDKVIIKTENDLNYNVEFKAQRIWKGINDISGPDEIQIPGEYRSWIYKVNFKNVAKDCVISEEAAKHLLNNSKSTGYLTKGQMTLARIQTDLEKVQVLKKQFEPEILKITGLKTEEEFENYLNECKSKEIFYNGKMVKKHSVKFFRWTSLFYEFSEKFEKLGSAIHRDVKSLMNPLTGPLLVTLPAGYNEEELNEFTSLCEALLCVVSLLGEHLNVMEGITKYDKDEDFFFVEGTWKYRSRYQYFRHSNFIDEFFKISDYVENKEIEAIKKNWKKFPNEASHSFYAVLNREIVEIFPDKEDAQI